MHKIRVGVFMGGKSIEREVSFNSGRTVCDHLDVSRYEVVPIFQTEKGKLYILPWTFLHRGKISDFEDRLPAQAQELKWDDLKKSIDFAYIATHGRYAEDGTLQGFLEVLNIPYLGAKVFASALGMDKIIQKDFLHNAGINVACSIVVSVQQINNFSTHATHIYAALKERNLDFPLVVKPHKEGSSLGISIVTHVDELEEALRNACNAYQYKQQDVLVEEKIEGMEFSCIVITDYKTHQPIALPPTEIVCDADHSFFDYEQKYMPGKSTKFTPARVSPEQLNLIQQTCIKTMQALEFTNMARIDGFLTRDNAVYIVDPNSLSGMGPASFLFRQAAQINMGHAQLINHLIETELEHYHMLDGLLEKEKMYKQTDATTKLRVGVLLGGASNEKEISLESGRNVVYKLSPEKYDVLPLFVSSTMQLYKLHPSHLVRNSTKEIELLTNETEHVLWNDLPEIVDFVFIALHGGKGEDGSIQGALEMLELPYNGSSVLASALCMDKFKTAQFLKEKGFDVPLSILVSKEQWQTKQNQTLQHIHAALGFPLIAKPHDDGCSVMVQKINTNEELYLAVENIFTQNKEFVLIEEFISGMELTVGVIGNDVVRALPPSKAVTAKDILSIEEKFLPGAGENQTPAPLPPQALAFVQHTIAQVYQALGCKGYSRIDCFYQSAQQSPTKKERVVILENNSLPGLTPATCIFHQAAEIGVKPKEFIDILVQLGLQEHKKVALSQKVLDCLNQLQS